MNIKDIMVAAGGSTVIVVSIVVAIWKLTEKSIVERVKHGFAEEMEVLKNQLARSGVRIDRYEAAQFGIYQELWDSLADLKIAADRLWEAATQRNLDEFGRRLENAENSVLRHQLLLELNHREELGHLLKRFHEFYDGKEGLIIMRRAEPHDQQLVQKVIVRSERIKNEFSGLVDSIGTSFQNQMRSGLQSEIN
jgi:hypothetical protein